MFFSDLKEAPPDPILGLKQAFLTDPRNPKIDLGVGNYKTAELREVMMEVVKEAEKAIFSKENIADYLPIDGEKKFIEEAGKLVFGNAYQKERIYGGQTLGGTGALRVCGDFLASLGVTAISIPNPTWPNHLFVFEKCRLAMKRYPYYSKEKRNLDFEALLEFFSSLEEQSVVLLQVSCNNPTGCDPNREEWTELCHLFKKKRLFPFFDLAYQGLGVNLEEDAWPVRLFMEKGHEMAVATTFSKNFSLYSQRIGALFLVLENERKKKEVASNIKRVMRPMYSNPPSHGAYIVAEILSNPTLHKKWLEELSSMRQRIGDMRKKLVVLLKDLSPRVDYSFMCHHKGMFSFCNLEKAQVQKLINDYAIYLPDNGRINMAGLNDGNLEYVAKAISDVS